ncbi:cation:proton antiporter [Mycobacterium sp. 141]|uniref:cation:proton antiporter n=1 Tax=Mycobacterium sp. 141 TaxID=1120797 RepID=UPI00036F88BD|nr:cation:proton antiporter [Mycobacterium sp. 141]
MPLGNTLQALVTLAVIVIASVFLGNLFAKFGQPRVLGPITLGIVVGSAVAVSSEPARTTLISSTSRFLLDVSGTAALLLLMFAVGLELRTYRTTEEASVGWRVVPSVALPIVVCTLAAWPFAMRLSASGDSERYGWLFAGIALGVTAVPVLVMIVKDLCIGSRPSARAALGIAVNTDGCAWILVTVLIVLSTNLSAVSILNLVTGAGLLLIVIFGAPRVIRRNPRVNQGGGLVATMIVTALTGAAATQFLGFHPAIGAVIAGFSFPAGTANASSERTLNSIIDVLLPAFFVSAAMSVPVQTLRDQVSWGGLGCLVVLTIAAILSKIAVGFMFGAMYRWPWRSAAELGVLLNCRGVTEIAIASVGFGAGLISPFAFAVLCALALVTTTLTVPLYRAFTRSPQPPDGAHAVAEPSRGLMKGLTPL